MANETFYVKLPGRNDYSPVDVDNMSWVNELYVRDPGRGGRPQYVRSFGTETRMHIAANPLPLLEEWRNSGEIIEAALPTNGANELAKEVRKLIQQLPALINAIACGEAESSKSALAELCYTVQALAAEANRQAMSIEQLRDVTASLQLGLECDDVDFIYRRLCRSVARDITTGLEAIAQIRKYETELDELTEVLRPRSTDLTDVEGNPTPWLRDQLSRLGHDSGFCADASLFLMNQTGDTKNIEVRIEEALAIIRRVESNLATTVRDREDYKALAHAAVEQFSIIEQAIARLERCRQELRDVEGGSVIALAISRGDLNQPDLDQWRNYSSDREWNSVVALERKIRAKRITVSELAAQDPQLPREAVNVLTEASEYIDRLNEVMKTESPAVADEPPVRAPLAESAATTVVAATPVAAPPDLQHVEDPLDTDTVYAMALAVASVVYCSKDQRVLGSPNAILDILARLGKVTDKQTMAFRSHLMRKMKEKSYVCREIKVGEKTKDDSQETWDKVLPTRAHWIQFDRQIGKGKRTYWKLCAKSRHLGARQLGELGLTEEGVRRALAERRAFMQERREQLSQATSEANDE